MTLLEVNTPPVRRRATIERGRRWSDYTIRVRTPATEILPATYDAIDVYAQLRDAEVGGTLLYTCGLEEVENEGQRVYLTAAQTRTLPLMDLYMTIAFRRSGEPWENAVILKIDVEPEITVPTPADA